MSRLPASCWAGHLPGGRGAFGKALVPLYVDPETEFFITGTIMARRLPPPHHGHSVRTPSLSVIIIIAAVGTHSRRVAFPPHILSPQSGSLFASETVTGDPAEDRPAFPRPTSGAAARDFVSNPTEEKFEFLNPNAKAVCGCNESFTV